MVKKLTLKLAACVLALVVLACAVWCAVIYANYGSLSLRCGMLATPKAPYLDGSGRNFQECSWHLGNATRTWGETYGVRLWRAYVSVEVRHTNPSISPHEAKEDE